MEIGGTPESFSKYSLGEIIDIMSAYQKREKRRQEEKTMDFKSLVVAMQTLSIQIRDAFGIDGDGVFRTVLEFYPELFQKDKSVQDSRYQKQLKERNHRMKEFSIRHNAKFRNQNRGE